MIKKYGLLVMGILLGSTPAIVQAKGELTKRVEQFSNSQVRVWKTIIFPASGQALPLHRHEHDRVVVALTDGLLKITTNKGKSHYLKLKKDKAYYLSKDVPNELHYDVNMTNHAIKVMVIELNNQEKL